MVDHGITWRGVVDKYVNGVLSGSIVSGELLKRAVSRYVSDLEMAEKRGFYLDCKVAEDVLSSWPLLFRHTTGEYAGHPFVPYPWQAFQLWNIFGWRRIEDKRRRFRTAYISVARGNGKSPLGASILLDMQIADIPLEVNASCYCAATTREQASIVFGEAKRMVEASPELRRLVQVRRNELLIPGDGSCLKPLASDGKNVHGLVIHGCVIDELHAWKDQHRTLREAIDTALGKRAQPLCVTITTAGDSESELWKEDYEYSRSVLLNQSQADTHYACIYEIDDTDDELDPACWPKANPMLEFGVVKESYLLAAADKAKAAPETRLSFKRYHCNKQVESSQQIITADLWAKGDGEFPPIAGAKCYLGFDWGWRNDLAALGRCYVYDTVDIAGVEKRRYAVMVDVWTPEECPRILDRPPWSEWVREGWLKVTPGDTTDTDAVYSRVQEIRAQSGIGGVVFDGNNCREFGSKCSNQWRLQATPIGQSGVAYHEPLQELLSALREGRLIHGGNPLLAWAAMNMVTKTSAGSVGEYMFPQKRKSKDKIDPIIAVIYSIASALWHGQTRKSVYEDSKRKVIVL